MTTSSIRLPRLFPVLLTLAVAGCASQRPNQASPDVRIVQTDEDVSGCMYLKTVSAAEHPYREGRTVFDGLRAAARREGANAVRVQSVEGSDPEPTSAGPTNALTAKLYRCEQVSGVQPGR